MRIANAQRAEREREGERGRESERANERKRERTSADLGERRNCVSARASCWQRDGYM